MTPCLALTTLDSLPAAEALAVNVVERGLAACANLLPGVHSIYRWKGEVEQAQEVLVVMKTSAQQWDGLQAAIREGHPYDCPELLLLSPEQVEARYLEWWSQSLSHPPATNAVS